jgi:hypothetical protein
VLLDGRRRQLVLQVLDEGRDMERLNARKLILEFSPLLSERLNGGFRLDVVSTRTLRIALLPEDEILLRQKRNALFPRSFPDNRLALPDVGIGY